MYTDEKEMLNLSYKMSFWGRWILLVGVATFVVSYVSGNTAPIPSVFVGLAGIYLLYKGYVFRENFFNSKSKQNSTH